MGVHGCYGWICRHYHLYDGKPSLFFVTNVVHIHFSKFFYRFRRFYLLMKAFGIWSRQIKSALVLFSPTLFSEISYFRFWLHLGCM